ncbi:exodeoxyribonuclease VII small subunit [Levilactobacillus brevis]|uniref:exodeoxyribonuclease VII small subunit n=1 Tax=Levilactobacillus brevis TaxID=1580 RepID=UPI001C1EE4B1|nr:exodeoxyribonuclease VII small subunit [Levilactobacillus brevis]MBU7539892.1 exodeoxyribonuclease VII small subunit [Levilactobacillus brevis]MBU7559508.1 exodeoxyribonuclease VII small subunit [Levilactobacillus brevis]MBU7566030.1 exodeoxyribonuclease VII small subunit [Levilactobacillus brevis]MCE6011080.1 exodeoxyribonuclease VII small subunit [Levilactobacillus brevis]MCE6013529.1 exodeoxyribonuclease VII small subunit [Levilactobacillus brevis]
MSEEQPTFEENLATLETIVAQLEQGDIPLEQALTQFQKGVALSKELQATLQDAEKTLTTMMNDSDQEVAFETPQGGTGDAD